VLIAKEARCSAILHLPSGGGRGSLVCCSRHGTMDQSKPDNFWLPVPKIHCPGLPICSRGSCYGESLWTLMKISLLIYFLRDFGKVPRTISQQPPGYRHRPIAIRNALFSPWWMSVSCILPALVAAYDLRVGRMEHRVLQPHYCTLSHLCQ
jgi:hypothetical protein